MSMENRINIQDVTVGMALPEVEKFITQEDINRYAEVSQDFNPIHVDLDFAKKTLLGGTIAHGMLTLAYVSEMMTLAFGQSWLSGGNLGIRFKSPARPGDTLCTTGKVRKVEKDTKHAIIQCDVLCSNQKGETIIIGETKVRVEI